MTGNPVGRPAWFTPARYAEHYGALAGLSDHARAHLWLRWLEGYRDLRDLAEPDWRRLAEAAAREMPQEGRPPTDMGFTVGADALPPIEVVARPQKRDASRYPSLGTALVLSLNIDAPDEVLIAALQETLRRVRQEHPMDVKRRGRRKQTHEARRRVTPQRLDGWRNARICEVAELDWWARQQDNPPSLAERARWIFGEDVDQPNRQMARARGALNRALDAIPVLCAELLPASAMVADGSDFHEFAAE